MSETLEDIFREAVSIRHELHRYPELNWDEKLTSAKVRQHLDAVGLKWRSCAEFGTLVDISAGSPGPTIALRCDLDALAIEEQVDLKFRSERPGLMHACGHDGHTAVLCAVASLLAAHRKKISGTVRLIFQPAEEGGHGAREMIADGALIGVDCIYGWHNWPAIPRGQAVCPDRTVMCGNGTFEIEIVGQGGHSSQPELCVDPVLAGSAVTLALQSIVSRKLPPQSSAVVSLTSFDGKSGLTTIPDRVFLSGSIRFDKPHLRDQIFSHIKQIATDTARAYGARASVNTAARYNPTINHSQPAEQYRRILTNIFGETVIMQSLSMPVMASEDFSYYLEHIPGAFALIGISEGEAYSRPCHSPYYQFNDAIIPDVVAVLLGLIGVSLES